MAGLTYPPELPRPISSAFTPAPRVRRSDLPGTTNQASREREFRGITENTWFFTAAEAGWFDDWWRYELREGGLLWSAQWPLPTGWAVDNVRKFSKAPRWALKPGRMWQVTAPTEVHGRRIVLTDAGFDARAAGWPGSLEYAIIDEDGALIRDVSVPWNWADLPDEWRLWRGWDGQISYIYTADLGAVRESYVRVAAAGVRTPIVERQVSVDGTWGAPLIPVSPTAGPDRFTARYVRIRLTATGPAATITAARISIIQRT